MINLSFNLSGRINLVAVLPALPVLAAKRSPSV